MGPEIRDPTFFYNRVGLQLSREFRICRHFKLHLDPTRLAFIEGLVCLDYRGEWRRLREHFRRHNRSAPDELNQMREKATVIAIPHFHREILAHCLSNGKRF